MTDAALPSSESAPSTPIPPAGPSALRRVFIGKEGLRAGWSLLIFIVMIVVCILRSIHRP